MTAAWAGEAHHQLRERECGMAARGSKLDAEKRSEYQSQTERVEAWDTAAWPSWTVSGRVLPERSDVRVSAVTARGVGAGGRIQTKFEVQRSHIIAVCAVERGNVSVFELADVVRTALAFPVDYIAFQNRGAYEIVLDLCIHNQTGEVAAIPIFEPTFDIADASLCFDAQSDKSRLTFPWAAAGVPEYPTALHDLTGAIRYPRRTFEYCRMAVEAVRRHFDPPSVKGHKERWRDGEKAMCEALGVTRKSLQALDALAARSRHGELVFSMNWPMRKRVLEFAWELVARFSTHLQSEQHDPWRLLDSKFEE